MLNLGGLFFTLDADTRGLMNAQRRVERFADTTRNAFRGVGRGTVDPQLANQLLRQERAAVQMIERIKAFQHQIGQTRIGGTREAQAMLEQLGRAYDNFTRKMNSGVPLNNLDFSRRIMHMTSQLNDARRAFAEMNAEANRAKGMTTFSGLLHGIGASSLIVQGHLGGMSTRFIALSALVKEFGVVTAITAGAMAGLAAGIGLVVTQAVVAGRELQGLTAAFTAVSGNVAVAGTHLDFVKDVAAQAGLQFNDTARGFLRFLASAQVGGLTLNQTQDAFRGVSLAAATMQLSVQDTQGVFRALDQMLSKGTVQAEELRGQLGDRLPGAFVIAAASMGKTTAELNKMLKAGEVISSEFVPNFVSTMQTLWNIDPAAPINTLTASLGRLGNEWTYFGQALDRSIGATRTFQGIVDGLIGVMNLFSTNLTQIIGFVGMLTGAFIGLGVAMAVNALITYVAAWGSIVTAVQYAIIVVRQMVTAVLTLNLAMMANPALRIATMLVTLTAAVAGATIGYNMFTEAVEANLAAMDNTQHIQAYIDAQKGMEYQVRSTTEALIQQVAAQNAIDSKKATDALRAAGQTDQGVLNGVRNFGTAFASQIMAPAGLADAMTMEEVARRRREEGLTEADAAIEQARSSAALYAELQEILKKPDMPANEIDTGRGDDNAKKVKELSDSINQVEDFILGMEEAEARLAALTMGDQDWKLIDDVFKAQAALNQLNPAQLGAVDAALAAAGFTAGTLDERLGEVFTRTRQAESAAKAYIDVWQDLDSVTSNITELERQIAYMNSGGDPINIAYSFDGIEEAKQMLGDIDASSQQGQEALLALQRRMTELGFAVANTGTLFGDTANQLAAFLSHERKLEDLKQTTANYHAEMRSLAEDLQAYNIAIGAIDVVGASGQQAVQNAVDRGQAVRALVRDLTAQGESQEEINRKAAEYLTIMRQVDEASAVYDRMQEAAERTRDAHRDMIQAAVSGFSEVVRGVKSVGDALWDLVDNILSNMWTMYIQQPIMDLLDNMANRKAEAAGSGIDAAVAGISSPAITGVAANDNGVDTSGVDALNAATNAAAQAVNGNFLGAIVQSAVALVSGLGAEAAKTAATTAATAVTTQQATTTLTVVGALTLLQTSAISAAASLAAVAAAGGAGGGGGGSIGGSVGGLLSSLLGSAPGRAFGGPMSAGQLYQINEQGIQGEYFIPAMNGSMSPTGSGGAGNVVHIDARTTIDARGATAENIESLRAEMARRDARLEQKLPYLVDARVRDSSARGRY